MKDRFVNATLADRRKGREVCCQAPINHPARETLITSQPSSMPLPIRVAPRVEAKPQLSEEDKLRMEVARILAEKSKAPRPVPKARLIGMGSGVPDATKDYADVLAMLLGKK